MTQSAGRVRCPQCGASNFDTVATCYKCGTSLGQAGARPSANAPAAPMRSQTLPERSQSAANTPFPAPAPPVAYAMPGGYATANGDPGVARRAAILLALTFPWIGLPIGWAFMMIEDQRRQAIGRLCATWSLIALVFHLLLTFVMMQSIASYLPMILNIVKATQSKGQGGGGMPGMPSP